jgi:hypothetical protein
MEAQPAVIGDGVNVDTAPLEVGERIQAQRQRLIPDALSNMDIILLRMRRFGTPVVQTEVTAANMITRMVNRGDG